MSIGIISLAVTILFLWIIYKKHEERFFYKNFYRTFDNNSLERLNDLYHKRRGKKRKRIEHALDYYYRYNFNVLLGHTKDIENQLVILNRVNNLLHDYYTYKPFEARKVIAHRNEILKNDLTRMVNESRPFETIMNTLATIEYGYEDRFRYSEKDIYDSFATEIYSILFPIANKISSEVSSGGSLSFDITLPENNVGLFVKTHIILNSEGLKIGELNEFIPYHNIPDFNNEKYDGYMPLVSDDMTCLLIKPGTTGANLLKHILTQQRNRVSSTGPSPEIVSKIDNTFKERAKQSLEQHMRQHEEETEAIRQSYIHLCS